MVDLDEETYNKISRQNFNSGMGTSFSHFELFSKACVSAFLLYSISLFCLFIQIAVKTLRSVQHFSWPEFTSVSVALSDYQVSQSSDQHFLYRS